MIYPNDRNSAVTLLLYHTIVMIKEKTIKVTSHFLFPRVETKFSSGRNAKKSHLSCLRSSLTAIHDEGAAGESNATSDISMRNTDFACCYKKLRSLDYSATKV